MIMKWVNIVRNTNATSVERAIALLELRNWFCKDRQMAASFANNALSILKGDGISNDKVLQISLNKVQNFYASMEDIHG